MSFLTLNNMELPVAAESVTLEEEEIGERGRAFDGTPYQSIRSVKRSWSFKTTAISQAEAAAWKCLLRGDGQTWSFETDLYSDQGFLGTASDGTVVRTSADKKFGTYGLSVPALDKNFAAIGVLPGTRGTAFAWDVTYGHAFAVTTDGTKAVDGAEHSGDVAAYFNTQHVVFFGPRTFDDILIIPEVLPMSMLVGLTSASFLVAKPALPKLYMSGDIVSSAINVTGKVTGSKLVRGVIGGSFVSNAEELSVTLSEV